jgi:hypothetical protein
MKGSVGGCCRYDVFKMSVTFSNASNVCRNDPEMTSMRTSLSMSNPFTVAPHDARMCWMCWPPFPITLGNCALVR